MTDAIQPSASTADPLAPPIAPDQPPATVAAPSLPLRTLTAAPSAALMRIGTTVSVADAIGHVVMWVVISVVTLGFGLMLFPYSFAKHVLNRSYIEQDGHRVGEMKCEMDIAAQLGHAVVWFLLSIVTLGVAYIVYLYKVWGFALSRTRVV